MQTYTRGKHCLACNISQKASSPGSVEATAGMTLSECLKSQLPSIRYY